MSDVIAYALDLGDKPFDFAKHAIDAAGKIIEIICHALHRQPLMHGALHDPFNTEVDGLDAALGPPAQPDPGCQGRTNGWNSAQQQRADDDALELIKHTDTAADHQHIAIRQPAGNRNDRLRSSFAVRQAQPDIVRSTVGRQISRNALKITRDQVALGGEQRGKRHVMIFVMIFVLRICTHRPNDFVRSPVRNRIRLTGNEGGDSFHLECLCPRVDGRKQNHAGQHAGCGKNQRQPERSRRFNQYHGG